jgi:hypothetical protein
MEEGSNDSDVFLAACIHPNAPLDLTAKWVLQNIWYKNPYQLDWLEEVARKKVLQLVEDYLLANGYEKELLDSMQPEMKLEIVSA